MKKAIILVSGGMDSCVTAACALEEGFLPAFLHINYGQLTQKREYRAFTDIADFYGVKERLVVDIGYLKDIGGSSLTDPALKVGEGKPEKRVALPSTYVPFRNGNMISIAVSWAEVIKAEKIYVGAVEEDSSGYPDCSREFFQRFNHLLKIGLSPETNITVETPVIGLSKGEIVSLGVKLGAPLRSTWSCYREEEKACGTCESCFLRLKGFKEAGIKDPVEYL